MTVSESVRAVSTARLSQPVGVRDRARIIGESGGLDAALAAGTLPERIDVSLSEGLVLGLLRQGVRKYLAVFGHGSTDLGEILRIYEEEGVTRTWNFRSEISMAHAATALAWTYGETAAVVTSIGPGALQAMAASLASASNGVGVYHLYGDETTHGEGYNMQQIPKPEQGLYGRLTAVMGDSYTLHTPEALRDALRRGTQRVHHPYRAGPFYLLLPLNTQPAIIRGLTVAALPDRLSLPKLAAAEPDAYSEAVGLIRRHERIMIKAGGGARGAASQVRALAETIGAAVVLSPGSTGVLPDAHPQNAHVGGSKGSISGNYAMSEADLLIVIGSRAVCQADCSGVGFPKTKAVINLNGDFADAAHYNRTLALPGDIGASLDRLLAALNEAGGVDLESRKAWLDTIRDKKEEWRRFREERQGGRKLFDPVWGRPVLTQPAALKIACDFARSIGAVKYFDAGDVQAHGFQVVEDDAPGETVTETGASYMGFAASALMSGALAETPRYAIAFSGDGSFVMSPQVLIDAVAHGARGMIILFDNRRMAAISGLQNAQYGEEFRTNDTVAVDYVAWANSVAGVRGFDGSDDLEAALQRAHAHPGLSLVHVPVYYGNDPLGVLGAYGSWNVGNWVGDVQERYHAQAL